MEGGYDDPWPLDDEDRRWGDLDRRRRWPLVAGLAGVVVLGLGVRACVPVVREVVAETRLEVERNRGVPAEDVAEELAVVCEEVAGPLADHLDAPDPLADVPAAREVVAVLVEGLGAMPLVRGQLASRRETGLGALAEADEGLARLEAALADGTPPGELDELRADARTDLHGGLRLLGLDDDGVLHELAAGVSRCRGVPEALERLLVRRR